jgi:16S rRNA G966 N2-methylase RsmD
MDMGKLIKILIENIRVARLVLKKLGFVGGIRAVYEEFLFDFRHGVSTLSSVDKKDLEYEDFDLSEIVSYRPSFSSWTKESLDYLEKSVDFSKGNFIDMGCGKGKVLFVAAKYSFKKVIGIEYSGSLADICDKNIKKLGYDNNVSVLNVDATTYQPSEDDLVYYFFNPFKGKILDSTLKNITSVHTTIYLIYVNPDAFIIFDKYATKIHEFRTQLGALIYIYKSN